MAQVELQIVIVFTFLIIFKSSFKEFRNQAHLLQERV